MTDFTALPHRFADLADHLPEGYTLSERVLDPEIRLDLENGRIVVRLIGIRNVRGNRLELPAPTPAHGWVVDGSVLRPLPSDVGDLVRTATGNLDQGRIRFGDAIRLLRGEDMPFAVSASESFLAPGGTAAADLPSVVDVPGLQATLFPYQARGVSWMREAAARNGGLILADEMGLGKTLQIIALLLISPPPADAPALVICPTSLIANWVREIARFAPSLTVAVHRGPQRPGTWRGLQGSNVVIATYDTMVNDIAIFSAFEWSWVICDEAQAIKNPALEAQASARAHRRGQTLPVTVYRLFYEDTVERVMLDRSAWKQELGNETVPTALRDSADLRRALEITPETT